MSGPPQFGAKGARAAQRASPVDYVDLDLGDERVEYYRKRGIGSNVGIPGAAGLGAGISHVMYRVPKVNFNSGPTRNNVRRMRQAEYNAMMAAQAEERAAAAVVLQGEMNANVAGLVYSNDPMTKIDIDMPIHLASLANIVTEKVKEEKKRQMKLTMKRYIEGKTPVPNPTVDEVISAARNLFVENEENKIRDTTRIEAKRAFPLIPRGYVNKPSFMTQNQSKELARLMKEHIDRKMPKIKAVLAKLREGMIMGFAPPAPKAAPKKENLLHFSNLSSINFSAPAGSAAAGSGAPPQVDPFEGLGGRRKTRKSRKSAKKTRKGKRKA